MHYIESGAGPPVVLLHAFPADARMFDGARALLEEHARVITPDQRGLGESPLDGSSARGLAEEQESRRTARNPSIDLAANDVLALLDQLGLDQAILGGCSMGGYVAMAVLRIAPRRVSGLLLSGTKATSDSEEQQANRLSAADRAEDSGTQGWLAENSLPGLLGRTTHHSRPNVTSHVREMIETQPAEGVAWAQRAMAGRPDSTHTLRGFTGPTLVVVGEEDTLATPEAARDLAAALPTGELAIIPGVGHLAPMEDPHEFTRAVIPWLNGIG